jgi:hypothetical protein
MEEEREIVGEFRKSESERIERVRECKIKSVRWFERIGDSERYSGG